jgi:putative ABC transport system permease protein
VADGQAIAQLPGVAAVDEAVQSRQQLVVPGANTNASVIGTTPPYATIHEITMAEGSFFTAAQDIRASKVVVLGSAVRDDLFGADATGVVGKTVRISGQTFTVAGVAASKGGSGFNSPDNNTYIPLTTMQRYLTSQTYVGTIDVQAASADVMTQVQDDITNLLLERHKISNPELADFSVFNQADLVAAVSSVTQTFTLLLGSVAGISLLVGGIGIMNMMLTTVTERTREIGLRKAIGAKRRDINTQFLVEAIALTLAGGVIGVALGWGISFAVSSLGFVQAQVSLTSVLVAFGVSAAIGIVFGYYPARRASKLNPIDALRYE